MHCDDRQFNWLRDKEACLTRRAWSILSSGCEAKPHAYRNLSCRTRPLASVKLRNSSMASRDAAVWEDVTASTTWGLQPPHKEQQWWISPTYEVKGPEQASQWKLWQRKEKPNYRDDLLAPFRTLRISSLDAFLILWMRAIKLRGAVAEDSLSGSSCFWRACQCSKSYGGENTGEGKSETAFSQTLRYKNIPISPDRAIQSQSLFVQSMFSYSEDQEAIKCKWSS